MAKPKRPQKRKAITKRKLKKQLQLVSCAPTLRTNLQYPYLNWKEKVNSQRLLAERKREQWEQIKEICTYKVSGDSLTSGKQAAILTVLDHFYQQLPITPRLVEQVLLKLQTTIDRT